MDVVETSDGPQLRRGERYRVDAIPTASVADMEVAEEHARRWNPGLKSRMDATKFCGGGSGCRDLTMGCR